VDGKTSLKTHIAKVRMETENASKPHIDPHVGFNSFKSPYNSTCKK
jgi:hypothetical protein